MAITKVKKLINNSNKETVIWHEEIDKIHGKNNEYLS